MWTWIYVNLKDQKNNFTSCHEYKNIVYLKGRVTAEQQMSSNFQQITCYMLRVDKAIKFHLIEYLYRAKVETKSYFWVGEKLW